MYNVVAQLVHLEEGKTPAEACGIEVQGENKWLTLNPKRKSKAVASFLSSYFSSR